MKRYVICEGDDIKAYAYGRNGQVVACLVDSGFHTKGEVFDRLRGKVVGSRLIGSYFIENKSKGWGFHYDKHGVRIKF